VDVDLELPVEVEAPPQNRFQAVLILLMTLTTLWGTVVSYLQSDASNREDLAARQGQVYAIEATGEMIRANQQAEHNFFLYTLHADLAQRASLDQDEARTQRVRGDEEAASRWEASAARWREAQARLDQLAPLLSDPRYEGSFVRFYEEVNRDAYLRYEQQVAANQMADGWGRKADNYVSVLTTLAVALFLFGLSLTIHNWLRYFFVLVGLLIVGFSLLWTGNIFLAPVPARPLEAMEAYVDGLIASNIGDSFSGDEAARHYAEAIAHFDRAIALDPDYAAAYYQRGLVRIEAPEAIADFERAIALGQDDGFAYGNLGWAYYLQGRYEEALEATRRAIQLDPLPCESRFNEGLILLALDQMDEAWPAYEEAIACALQKDPSDRDALLDVSIVDLEGLLAREGEVAGARAMITNLKEVEASLTLFGSPVFQETPAVLGPITFAAGVTDDDRPINPATQFPPGTQEVFAFFDYQDVPPDSPWLTRWSLDGERYLVATYTSWPWGESGNTWVSLSTPGGLPPGRYTLDVFINGRLLTSGEFEVISGAEVPLVRYESAELDVAVAYPPDWQVIEEPGEEGFLAFLKPDSQTLFVLTRFSFDPALGAEEAVAQAIEARRESLQEQYGSVSLGEPGPYSLAGLPGQVITYQYLDGEEAMAGTTVAAADSVGNLYLVILEMRSDDYEADSEVLARMLESVALLAP